MFDKSCWISSTAACWLKRRSTFCGKKMEFHLCCYSGLHRWLNEVGLAVVCFHRAHKHKRTTKPVCVHEFSLCSGNAPIMPIRRAAATPTQEKAPSAVAEKGEAGVVHDHCNSRPVNAPLTQIHWGQAGSVGIHSGLDFPHYTVLTLFTQNGLDVMEV